MSDYSISIQCDRDPPPGVTTAWLQRVLCAVLRHGEQAPGSEATLVLTNNDTIRRLNRQYRQVDAPTDVLAFSAQEGEPFVLPAEARQQLGDVVISVETAARQAGEQGHALRRELALLIVHGGLHLLGYDHATAEDEAAMWALQNALVDEILGEKHAP